MRAKMSAARARAQTRGRRGRSAHLEDPSVEVTCGLEDPPRAQMASDLEDTGEQEVDDDRVREVLPVAAARRGEYERRGACAQDKLVHLAGCGYCSQRGSGAQWVRARRVQHGIGLETSDVARRGGGRRERRAGRGASSVRRGRRRAHVPRLLRHPGSQRGPASCCP